MVLSKLEENIYIGEGVEIASGVKLAGPLLIPKERVLKAAYNWATSSHRRRSANIKRSLVKIVLLWPNHH